MKRALVLVLLGCAVLGGSPNALAQQDKVTAERAAKAREAYDAGKKAYNLGDFDQAITLWKQGYEQKDDANFLYNIAQAYRQKSDFQKAIFYYKGYLREMPNAPNRAEIETKIVEMQKALEQQQSATGMPPQGVGPLKDDKSPEKVDKPKPDETVTGDKKPKPDQPKLVPTQDETRPSAPGKGMKIAGIVTGGVGVVLVATGIVFALQASSIASDLEASTQAGNPWSQALSDKESSGKTDATLAAITVGVGAAAIVGGGVLFYLGMRKDARAVERAGLQIVPMVGPTTAGMVFRFRY